MAVEESKVISELHNLVDALAKVCACLASMEKALHFFSLEKNARNGDVQKFLTQSDMQLASKPGYPESLQQLVEMIKNPTANVAAASGIIVGKEDKARQSRDKKVSGDVLVYYDFMLYLNVHLIQYHIVLEADSWCLR